MKSDFEFDTDDLSQKQNELLSAIGSGSNLLKIMCDSTIARIRISPKSYLLFGPYWWSVKKILNDNGYMLGDESNDYMANMFKQQSPELTLIAAWKVADYMQSNFFAGTRDYDLGDDDAYSLFDADMEQGG